jgi:hypothetical protein
MEIAMPHNASTPVSVIDTHNPVTTTTTTTVCPLMANMLRGAIQSLSSEQLLSLLSEEQKAALAPSETKQQAINSLEDRYPDTVVVTEFDDLRRKFSFDELVEYMRDNGYVCVESLADLTAHYNERDIADMLGQHNWLCFEDDFDLTVYAKDNCDVVEDDYTELKDRLEDHYDALVFEGDGDAREYVKALGEDLFFDLEDDLDGSLAKMMKVLSDHGYNTVSQDVIDQVVTLLRGTSEG